ncbi:MAG: ribosome maturation factor RimM [Pseudomonadota bacterium]|nr:ribosome maturation factor RimM [Pseudomonadota bacterium]
MAPSDATSHLISIATIVGVYGIKGWVKVRINLEDPASLTSLSPKQLTDSCGKRIRLVDVTAVRSQGKGFIAKFSGVDDRNAAESLRGYSIEIPESSLPRLNDGEFYWRDLIGCRVELSVDDESLFLGCVDHLIETGANDVLVVRPTKESIDDRERLIPWLEDDVIMEVDIEAQRISVRWYPDD